MKKEFKWTYEMDHIPRGEHELEGVTIQVSDLFGWVKKEAFIPNPKTIFSVSEFNGNGIYPN